MLKTSGWEAIQVTCFWPFISDLFHPNTEDTCDALWLVSFPDVMPLGASWIWNFLVSRAAWNPITAVGHWSKGNFCCGVNVTFKPVLTTTFSIFTTCWPWSFHTHLWISLSSKPVFVLLGVLLVWKIFAMLLIMTQPTTLETKRWKPFISETYQEFFSFNTSNFTPSSEGLV